MKSIDVKLSKYLAGSSAEPACERASNGVAALSVWVNRGVYSRSAVDNIQVRFRVYTVGNCSENCTKYMIPPFSHANKSEVGINRKI